MVPVLLLLVLGIAEFGRAYNIQTTVSGAAREGVRALALGGDAGAARAAAEGAAPTIDLGDGQIDVSAECPPDQTTPASTVTVTVTYQMPLVTNLFANRSFTLTGVGVMRCGG